MSFIAVIPARGGSKRLPRKNILPLKGKPLIVYSIEQALETASISRVIVSTDDSETASIAEAAGAEVPFIRPGELATDTTPTGPVLEHAVAFLEERENYWIDAIVTLQPTCPLRTPDEIEEAISTYKKLRCKTLMSVSHAKTLPWSVWFKDDELEGHVRRAMKYPTGENPANIGCQQLIEAYEANGAIYITDKEYLRETGNWIDPERTGYYIMSDNAYIDVDTEIDFFLLQKVFDNNFSRVYK